MQGACHMQGACQPALLQLLTIVIQLLYTKRVWRVSLYMLAHRPVYIG